MGSRKVLSDVCENVGRALQSQSAESLEQEWKMNYRLIQNRKVDDFWDQFALYYELLADAKPQVNIRNSEDYNKCLRILYCIGTTAQTIVDLMDFENIHPDQFCAFDDTLETRPITLHPGSSDMQDIHTIGNRTALSLQGKGEKVKMWRTAEYERYLTRKILHNRVLSRRHALIYDKKHNTTEGYYVGHFQNYSRTNPSNAEAATVTKTSIGSREIAIRKVPLGVQELEIKRFGSKDVFSTLAILHDLLRKNKYTKNGVTMALEEGDAPA